MKKISVVFLALLLVVGCGKKTGSYEALTSSGESITVPGSVLPAKIPQKFFVNELQANLQLPGFLIAIKTSPLYGGGNVLVIDNGGHVIILGSRVKEPGFIEKLLRAKSFSAQAVAVKMKDPDSYFVTFVPVDSQKVSWKKGLYAVVYQEIETRDVRIAYLDKKMLKKLGDGIGYSKIMSSISDAVKEINKKVSAKKKGNKGQTLFK